MHDMNMSIKKFENFVNELKSQSATAPIENSQNIPRYKYKNIADILGDKYHINTTVDNIMEFEQNVLPTLDEKPQSDEYYAKVYKEWEHKKGKETPPYSDDLISDKDFGMEAYKDDVRAEINEDGGAGGGGVASATGGNTTGMGAVSTSQPSSTPGQTIGGNSAGDSFGDGGVVGSGDIGAGQVKNKNVIKRPEKSRRKKKMKAQAKAMAKNMKNTFTGKEYKQGGDKNAHLMTFSEFAKK